MKLTSPAFSNKEFIPVKYTCNGEDISPPLQWQDVPKETRSFALIIDDPDAPTGLWTHWALYNLPGDIREMEEDFFASSPVSDDVIILANSWDRKEYSGPCPPGGKVHRYYFKLYALDRNLFLSRNIELAAFKEEIQSCVLEEAQLIGLYGNSAS